MHYSSSPHVSEQPFTRSLSHVKIPQEINAVSIKSLDSVHKQLLLNYRKMTIEEDRKKLSSPTIHGTYGSHSVTIPQEIFSSVSSLGTARDSSNTTAAAPASSAFFLVSSSIPTRGVSVGKSTITLRWA